MNGVIVSLVEKSSTTRIDITRDKYGNIRSALEVLKDLSETRGKLYLLLKRFLKSDSASAYLKKAGLKMSSPMSDDKAHEIAFKVSKNADEGVLKQFESIQIDIPHDNLSEGLTARAHEFLKKIVDDLEASGWSRGIARAIAVYLAIDLALIPTFGLTPFVVNFLAKKLGGFYFQRFRIKEIGPKLAHLIKRYS